MEPCLCARTKPLKKYAGTRVAAKCGTARIARAGADARLEGTHTLHKRAEHRTVQRFSKLGLCRSMQVTQWASAGYMRNPPIIGSRGLSCGLRFSAGHIYAKER
ncbi:hypothetical protein MRX96_015856 [Rhipicephalus microplus]